MCFEGQHYHHSPQRENKEILAKVLDCTSLSAERPQCNMKTVIYSIYSVSSYITTAANSTGVYFCLAVCSVSIHLGPMWGRHLMK